LSPGRVAVVSREAVRRFWPDRDPVGTSMALDGDSRPVRIVGVVSDVSLNWYDAPLSPVVYLLDDQQPARSTSVLVRAEHDPVAIAPRVRAALTGLDPQLPIRGLEGLDTTIADSLSPIRIVAHLLTSGALLAAALAAVGIFGVLAQFVAQRRREFGVRFALGATPRSIARIVVGDAVGIAVAGTAAGLSLALPTLGLLGRFLLGLPSIDAAAVAAVAVCGVAIALGAAYVPARRAARVDVAELLRLE
jgi:predicted lysophospholipase L1 biosynthesis ABC-type transport system permease subunit